MLRRGLLGSLAVGLTFLRVVDADAADTFGVLVVQDFEGVAVEVGKNLTCQVSSAEQRGNEKQDNEDCPLHIYDA